MDPGRATRPGGGGPGCRGRGRLSSPTSLTWPRPSSFQACAPGASRGRATPSPDITQIETREYVCVSQTESHLWHFCMTESQPYLLPSPQLSRPLWGEWRRGRCLSKWCDLKKVYTHTQNSSLTVLPEILIIGSQSLLLAGILLPEGPC
jgi:hypothetical protein